ncbi:N-acetyltransferase [Sphingomonas sp. RHCKR7]|uniref:GNAT family N-acetyltransferase n=1 Tax=Sphingomonas folli TaxID=2862497 RepID=UPI001C66C5CE|nr:N-acetyltransferase [Sphingomonas folli]MBW6526537.1 N-acetyltransferase [Sphingomonas folli]
MKAAIAVRAECPGDAPAILEIVVRAYANVIYSDHREHLMIERLRGTAAWIPPLSLLAEVGGRAVGHILLTKGDICGSGSWNESLALAPLSVVPDYQSRGVGKRLVESACQKALELGFGTIVLVGLPSYYPRYGFEPLSRYPITLPFDAPDENCMVLPLRPGALDGVAGVVKYAKEWLEH